MRFLSNLKHAATGVALALFCLLTLAACSESDPVEAVEYQDWQARNAADFQQQLAKAKTAVAQAKAQYGDAWEQYCPWRLLRNYAISATIGGTSTDTVVVEILRHGTGTVSPIATDSVRVNYIGRYMRNALSDNEESRLKGEIFTYTGVSKDSADVFSPNYSSPTTLYTTGTVTGFATALQHMHIGDLWRICMPQEMGYGSSSAYVRAYSTLYYDLELVGIYPAGTTPGKKP